MSQKSTGIFDWHDSKFNNFYFGPPLWSRHAVVGAIHLAPAMLKLFRSFLRTIQYGQKLILCQQNAARRSFLPRLHEPIKWGTWSFLWAEWQPFYSRHCNYTPQFPITNFNCFRAAGSKRNECLALEVRPAAQFYQHETNIGWHLQIEK